MNSIASLLISLILFATTFINATLNNPQVTIKSPQNFVTSQVYRDFIYVSVYGNNQLHQYNPNNGQFIRSFPLSHIKPITGIKAVGDFIYTASDDTNVKSWSISKFQKITTFDGHSNPITAFELSPTGRFMFSAAKNEKNVLMWQTLDPKLLKRFPVTDRVTDLLASPDSRRFYIITSDPAGSNNPSVTITEWDYIYGRKLRVYSFKGVITSKRQTAIFGNGFQDIYFLATVFRPNEQTFLNCVVKFNLNRFSLRSNDIFSPFLVKDEVTDIVSFSLGRLGVYMMSYARNLWRVNFDFNNLVLEKSFKDNSPDFNEYIDQSPGGNRLWVCKGNQLSAFAI